MASTDTRQRGRTCERAQATKTTTSDRPDGRLPKPKFGAYPARIQLVISSTSMINTFTLSGARHCLVGTGSLETIFVSRLAIVIKVADARTTLPRLETGPTAFIPCTCYAIRTRFSLFLVPLHPLIFRCRRFSLSLVRRRHESVSPFQSPLLRRSAAKGVSGHGPRRPSPAKH